MLWISILFFLGTLLAVGALETTGVLRALAEVLSQSVGNLDDIIFLIGIGSAAGVVVMGMEKLAFAQN